MNIGLNIIELSETESTNLFAQELIKKKKCVSGTIVKSNFQSEGKGHSDSIWESEEDKNLMFSLILFPEDLKVQKHFYLSKVVSLAICTYFKTFIPNTKIKWPNDIFCNGKKISGILIKNTLMLDNVINSIIGVGININQKMFKGDFIATSLFNETGKEMDVSLFLTGLTKVLNNSFKMLSEKEYDKINSHYLGDLYLYEQWAKYKDANGIFEGKIVGVEEVGNLKIITKSGEPRLYGFKEVTLLK